MSIWAKWTPERAQKRLEEEIKEAHERYEKRIEMHAKCLARPNKLEELRAKREARWVQAEDLRSNGMTYKEVGKVLGVSPSQASVLCNSREARRWRKEEDACYEKELAEARIIGAAKRAERDATPPKASG